MFEVFGGKVVHAGEIVHGKTSPISHDNQGMYAGVPQNIQVTRYHSLAGDPVTLPDSLIVTSKTANGIIMGVRHREYTVEGVQYHPESIVSEHGKLLFENFLRLRSGTWATSRAVAASANTAAKQQTILQRIHEQRLKDVEASKSILGRSMADLTTYLSMGLAPAAINVYERVRLGFPRIAVMAEFKRASPSKGDINVTANAVQQALQYSEGGASVISVLTEPTWFKGSLEDLRLVRQAVDRLPQRPAVLRKDFIFDPYQIAEARLAGADTVLLIVAILSEATLSELMAYARSLMMEPLVEVNNAAEMDVALRCGARIIGVNNRNLHSFSVDMSTTTSVSHMVSSRPDVILCALSGITGRSDVETYSKSGVKAVLVGEALMRSSNVKQFIEELRQPIPQ